MATGLIVDSEQALSLLALAEDAEVGLSGPESARWMENLEKRLGELRTAAAWFLSHGEPERALRLAAALTMFWREGNQIGEGRKWMESILAGPGAEVPSAARAKALYGAGRLAFTQGDQEASRTRNEEALRMARAADDWGAQVLALVGLARVALRDGDLAVVRDNAKQARRMARDMGDQRAEAGPLHLLAAATRMDGDVDGARRLYEESLQLNRELGDQRVVAMELLNLGFVQKNLGDLSAAETRFRGSLELQRERGDATLVPEILIGLGCTAAARGDLERAARLLAAGQARLDAAGAVLDPDDQPEFDRAASVVREGLDPAIFDALWAEGLAMDADRAVDLALRSSS
ncbi:MAG TPA: tetratricopeptide repeat protein [Actinomycetota bacterium]|nr:tetratricopeptide repeat protein [Actinomycetota bacterium]